MKTLASNCLFVKGYNKNLLIDLQNNNWYHIEQSKSDLISEDLNEDMKNYLIEHGVLIDIPPMFLKNFTLFSTKYDSPSQIESVIMDIDSKTEYNIIESINKIDHFNPIFLQLRFFCDISFEKVENILINLNDTTIECVEIIMPFNKIFFYKLIERNIAIEYTKFKRLIFHTVQNYDEHSLTKIQNVFYTKEQISDHNNCGQVGYYNFSNNSNHILKSMNFNSCLYKKIGIDVNGNIKNCPSLTKILGNIEDNKTIKKFSFDTEYIKKDDIEVCKDCEFRYICTDCRAYTDSTLRSNARPSKCNYNPYIAKWSHEEGFRTLEECGVISNEYEFSIDHKKIAKINKELWGDE